MKTLLCHHLQLPRLHFVLVACLTIVTPAFAKPVPDNLGNGLNRLVESNLILQGKMPAPAADLSAAPNGTAFIAGKNVATYDGFATRQAANYAAAAITEAITNKVMVDIVLSGAVAFDQVRQTLTTRFSSLKITAVDATYRNAGVIEGYVSLDEVVALSQTDGVRSVNLGLKPYRSQRLTPKGSRAPTPVIADLIASPLGMVGSTFDQGVTQHRVDKINRLYNPSAAVDWEGTNMTVGCISDTFDTNQTGYAADVGTHDLPGAANPINTQPVFVFEDVTDGSGTDEGRGMCQIVYKMAPKAQIGFATAYGGEVGFANNIRGLANLPGFGHPGQTFKADVICDDVGYFDEPYFQTGIVGRGVNDVHDAGVSYFSSAANDIGINGYDSDLRMVPASTAVDSTVPVAPLLRNSNINLAQVPANLYAGGFHNFSTASSPDYAQTVNVPSAAVLAQYLLTNYPIIFQWDDPYDPTVPTLIEPPIWMSSGSINGTTTMSVTFDNTSTPPLPPFSQGTAYVITEHQTSGDFDAIIKVIDPNGNTIINQDTGVDETVTFFPQISGQYKIEVDKFATTSGSFDIKVNTTNATALVTTDLNLLVFDMSGNYVASKSLTANNIAGNRPVDVGTPMADNSTQLQYVIARSNTPPATPQPATHVRWVMPGNGIPNLGPAEYFTYGSPTTGGHAIAAGCNGTAAYSVFRPSIPEYFTSPGPGTIYFDDNNNRISPPLIRQQPSVAAADGGNTSFFGGDSGSDSDSDPNFYGTSAAAPHAAAIAALVLQAHGGSGSLTPAQVTTILHNTAFPHDLDPHIATGTATTSDGGTVTVTIHSDNDNNGGPLSGIGILPAPPLLAFPGGGTGEFDPNSISVSYTGPGNVTSVILNPNGVSGEGGNVTGGENGVDNTNTYFSNVSPGVAFLPIDIPFTVGTSLPNSLAATDVVATPSNQAPAPSNPGTAYWTLGLQFPTGSFTSGKSLHFTIGRGEQHASDNSTIHNATGDIWGGGVLIPEGTITTPGMKFRVTTSGGGTVDGTMVNQIGQGYTSLDGYGFINAEAAVNASLPAVQLTGVVSRKIHSGAGTFDINMPLTGNPGIECRDGGPNKAYTLVFTFPNPLTSVSSASVSSGTGSASGAISPTDPHQYIVNLTGVTSAQRIVVTLSNVSDNAGEFSAAISVPMGVLVGDVNASGVVTTGDTNLCKAQALQPVTASNFRDDINASGQITTGDVNLIKQHALEQLPP